MIASHFPNEQKHSIDKYKLTWTKEITQLQKALSLFPLTKKQNSWSNFPYKFTKAI